MSSELLISALNTLGEIVSTEPAVLEKHACDWSNVNRQRPLAVLRPRRTAPDAASGDRPARRGPSWDDVLFGSAPAAKDA